MAKPNMNRNTVNKNTILLNIWNFLILNAGMLHDKLNISTMKSYSISTSWFGEG